MTIPRHVFFIGARACGKTSVGRRAAEALEAHFVDTDHELVEGVGLEISDYVERNGWDAFRDRETETLERIVSGPPCVVGCGGGLVLRRRNRKLLAQGFVLYLEASVDVLAARLASDPLEAQRPSLTGKSIVDEVAEVLEARRPLYLEAADVVLQDGPLDEVVSRAMLEIGRMKG